MRRRLTCGPIWERFKRAVGKGAAPNTQLVFGVCSELMLIRELLNAAEEISWMKKMSKGEFQGKVAVVTGAARGIGKATAMKLAQEGASVMLCDLLPNELNASLAEFKDMGFAAAAFNLDISVQEEVNRMAASVLEKYGAVDILVNNAGISQMALADDIRESDWDRLLGVNLKGTFFCIQAFMAGMKENRYGKIVSVSSRASLGKTERTAYSATKAGIIGMTRTLALELAPYNINVNCVGPGPIATEMFDRVNPKDSPRTKAIVESIPLKRMGTSEDVANLISFLSSERSSFITGQMIYICGGMSVGSVGV